MNHRQTVSGSFWANRFAGRRRRFGPRRAHRRRGLVLLVVVVVVVMLTLAGLSYVSLLYTEHKAVHLSGDEVQADHLVGSGEEMLKVFLESPYQEQYETGGWFDNPDRFRGVLVFGDERSGPRGRFSILSPRIENGEVSGIRFGLENESARLNLGVLPQWEKQQPGAGRQALMYLPGMTESIADAILDWVDADATAREYGAEEDDYVELGAPYAPRNAPPTSLEELLLVRGVTHRALFGHDSPFDFQADQQRSRQPRSPLSFGGSGEELPWSSRLTVHSAERNTTPEGEPRIHLNEKDLAKLHRQLSLALPADWARFIIAYRQHGPSRGRSQAGGEAEFQLDLSLPAKVSFRSVLDLVDAKVRIPREGKKKPIILKSPFGDVSTSLGDSLSRLLDQVTVVPGPVIRGRVNVNLASREVLRAVPGIDDFLADRIAAGHNSQAEYGDPTRRHAIWLLTDGLVELDTMRKLMPYITGGGDVYRAQIVGFFDHPGPSARVEVVIDATTKPPRQVYWKDLRMLGLDHSLRTLGGKPPADAEPQSIWDRDERQSF